LNAVLALKGRCLNPGEAEARLLVIPRSVSFYGELEEGFDEPVVLLVASTRGSTVAPYVIYRLARRGRAPRGIGIWGRAEPMIVAGCVLAGIPLADMLGRAASSSLEELARLDCIARLECSERGGAALLTLRCG